MEAGNLAFSDHFLRMSKVSKLMNFEQTMAEWDTLPNLHKNHMQV